jgi:hypothetical protein
MGGKDHARAKGGGDKAAAEHPDYLVPLDDAMHHEITMLFITNLVSNEGDVARVIQKHPELEREIMTVVHNTFGNAYAAKVTELVHALRVALPSHTAGVEDRDALSSGAASATDAKAPLPGDPLPFDHKGGWNGLAINQKLGQYDRMAGTDSDGARCGHATSLAIQILGGPAALIAWLKDYTKQHEPVKMTPKQAAACDVMIAVIAAIDARTATYGDLSWTQEALHDYTIADDAGGTPSSAFVTAGKKQTYTPVGGGYTKAAPIIEHAETLVAGEQLLCAWRGMNAAGSFDHQFMIANHEGALYLYDSERQDDGVHMRPLTKKALTPYIGNETDWVEIHGKVSPKAPVAAGKGS